MSNGYVNSDKTLLRIFNYSVKCGVSAYIVPNDLYGDVFCDVVHFFL